MTSDEFIALAARVEMMELAIQQLGDAVDELRQQRDHGRKPPPPQTPNGTLARGKYSGQAHQLVAQKDPDYVVWNDDKGYATGLGFTEEQIMQARSLLEAHPELRQNLKRR